MSINTEPSETISPSENIGTSEAPVDYVAAAERYQSKLDNGDHSAMERQALQDIIDYCSKRAVEVLTENSTPEDAIRRLGANAINRR